MYLIFHINVLIFKKQMVENIFIKNIYHQLTEHFFRNIVENICISNSSRNSLCCLKKSYSLWTSFVILILKLQASKYQILKQYIKAKTCTQELSYQQWILMSKTIIFRALEGNFVTFVYSLSFRTTIMSFFCFVCYLFYYFWVMQ